MASNKGTALEAVGTSLGRLRGTLSSLTQEIPSFERGESEGERHISAYNNSPGGSEAECSDGKLSLQPPKPPGSAFDRLSKRPSAPRGTAPPIPPQVPARTSALFPSDVDRDIDRNRQTDPAGDVPVPDANTSPLTWSIGYTSLLSSARALERQVVSFAKVHGEASHGHGHVSQAQHMDLPRVLEEAGETDAAERARLLSALASVQGTLARMKEALHLSGGGVASAVPKKRAHAVQKAAGLADTFLRAVSDMREGGRKAYLKLSAEQSGLEADLASAEALLVEIEGEAAQATAAEAAGSRVLFQPDSARLLGEEPEGTEGGGQEDARARLRRRIDEIDSAVSSAGGAEGGWDSDDHRLFMAQLASFLSARGRPHSLTFHRDAGPGTDRVGAPPLPLLSAGEQALFVDRLAAVMPGWPMDRLAAHTAWYAWWRGCQEEKLACVSAWKAARKEGRAAGSVAGSGSGLNTSGLSRPRTGAGTDPATRVAIAEWRAQKQADEAREAAHASAREGEAEAAKESARAARVGRQKKTVEEWKRAQAAAEAAEAARQRLEDAIQASVVQRGAGGVVDARVRRARAHVSKDIAAAKARREAGEAKRAELEAAKTRRFGPDGQDVVLRARQEAASRGMFDWWESSLPPDPDRPTVAQVARVTTVAERQSRTSSLAVASAHDKPIASVIPTARGRGFAFGVSAGVLPSRATPAWRKGV